MSHPLVSIIVPIYKVEPYLRRCIDSIVNQTYTNLEIILVDDGSPDDCPRICDEYAEKDKRFVAIHKENGGLSDARNAGLDICKGDYISFIDSDDWINDCYVQDLLFSIESNNADIAVASCKYISDDSQYANKFFPITPGEISYNNILLEIYSKQNPSFVAACIKMFSRNLILSFRFHKERIHEDEYLNYQWFYKAKKVVYEPSSVYYYFLHADSITGQSSKYDKLEILNQQYAFFTSNNIKIPLQWILPSLCWEHLWNYGNFKMKKEACAQEHFNLFQHFTNLTLKEKNVPKAIKFFFFMCSKMPFIYLFYRRFSPFRIRK